MDKIYIITWECEDSMDHGIHGAYTDVTLAAHTVDTFSKAENSRNYELTSTLLCTQEV